jgi:uncharacterized membrane protein YphA (DoxX/SURF4 family)
MGISAFVQGGYYLTCRENPSLAMILSGVALLGSGVLLLIGLLTPAAGAIVGFYATGIALSWLPAAPINLFENKLTAIYLMSMAFAMVTLGPGAFSFDARIFGRREIIIPPRLPHS